MAESVLFGFASNILSTIATRAFKEAYERVCCIRDGREDLDKLRSSIRTIQAVLLDAEKKQQRSAAVKDWIKRVRDVLYDADDLFDEVATDDMLKPQIMEENLINKVRMLFVSGNPIAMRVKDIRNSLVDLSKDMEAFRFVTCLDEKPISSRLRREEGFFVDSEDVIGRDEDKKAILEMVFNESKNNAKLDVIAIVGIGGMGKTTLAQQVYNHEKVKNSFQNRWFACISNTSDDREIIGKIFQSMDEGKYSDFTVGQLQSKIMKSIKGNKFLVVLDDVWDADHDSWLKRMKLLSGGVEGSKIIVTTRSLAVASAVGASKPHRLDGLSEDASWALFKSIAFAPGDENDPKRIALGREIVEKCRNVPLAIRSIASLLFRKNTILEWEHIRNKDLPNLGQSEEDGIMPVLKLSYDHLPSNLKQCFAYCSLFPEDCIFDKEDLIHLWIAQGYINSVDNEEAVVGHSYFMDLLRGCFFQEVERNGCYTIVMHDLIHALARHVAGDESIIMTASSSKINFPRHVSVANCIDNSWAIPALERNVVNQVRIRSFMCMDFGSICKPALDQLFAEFKRLRALRLRGLGIEDVPSSIGELKHLRYLDLSDNNFESLPDSITNLLNLMTLNMQRCRQLEVLPDNFRKLINLKYLNIRASVKLKHMPAGIGEMTRLEHLSDLKVGKTTEGVETSGIDALAGLELTRDLQIDFAYAIAEDWDGSEECWKLPVLVTSLTIWNYPGRRMPRWGNGISRANEPSLLLPNLMHVELAWCKKVKHLPPLRCLPNLKSLCLWDLCELEYMEEEEEENTVDMHSGSNNALFFPCLEELTLVYMYKLKGWRRKGAASAPPLFLSLSHLCIRNCPELESIPLCPSLQTLCLTDFDFNEVLKQSLSNQLGESESSSPAASATPSSSLSSSSSFKEILVSPLLRKISITRCRTWEILHLAPPQLQQLRIWYCKRLKKLHIAHPNAFEVLTISGCPVLELWEEDKMPGVDWDSLTNLRTLKVDPLPPPEKLPACLRHLQAQGQLQITKDEPSGRVHVVWL